MKYIRVWCEYDISGNFGGYNNEEVFAVAEGVCVEDVEDLVISHLINRTGLDIQDLDGLYGVEFISIQTLGGK